LLKRHVSDFVVEAVVTDPEFPWQASMFFE
jgi:hypothetical protein